MKRVNLCMSGGRTSAYMVEELLYQQFNGNGFSDVEFVITFANTGKEHEKTLWFVHQCDMRWRELYAASVVWLEAAVHHGRKPCSHRVVEFATASRKGEPFKAVVAKYGLPNGNFLHCTRELKENPIMSYMVSLGEQIGHIRNKRLVEATYETYIGIREDEPKRLGGSRNGKQKKFYPLAEPFDDLDITCDKQDSLDFWSGMPFDLGIPEHWGNCVDCHKKSDKKLEKVYQEDHSAFDFANELDEEFSHVKPQVLNDGTTMIRKRYRGYRNTKELIESFKIGENVESQANGCETSCEPFMMENVADEPLL